MKSKKPNKNMEHLANFENFDYAAPAPAKPKTTPKTKPGTRPGRPSPIRRDKPSVDPKPKATIEEIMQRYEELMNAKKS